MIDATRIEFIEKEENLFIHYELLKEEKISKVELEVLKNNEISNILDISEIYEDGKEVFLYNVTSKVQLFRRLQAAFSGEQLYKMLQSLCRVWMCVDEYMLDRKHFIFYPEVMYVQQETSELFVMVLPIYAEDDKEMEFRMILIGIFSRLLYYDEILQEFYLKLQKYVSENLQFTVKKFKEFLEQVYKEEQGILQPISEAPVTPENQKKDGKKIVHEEEAKAILQSRFQAVNDEVKFFEDVVNPIPSKTIMENGKVPVPLSIDRKKTSNIPVFGISMSSEKKKEEKKLKSERVKKTKEKREIEQKQGYIPSAVSLEGAQPMQEKEEKSVKKGLFHIFRKKKKEETEHKSKEENIKIPTPVNNVNNHRVPTNTGKWNANQSPIEITQDSYSNQLLVGNEQNLYSHQTFKNQNDNRRFVGNDMNNGQVISRKIYDEVDSNRERNNDISQNSYPAWTLPVQKKEENSLKFFHGEIEQDTKQKMFLNSSEEIISTKNEKEFDLDSTILLDKFDLDATTLIDSNTRQVNIPVLRSKEIGEIIKITYSGFLVGRQRVRDGKVIKEKGKKQPDLILAISNVSHSHAIFIEKNGEWYIIDQGSLNGTFINEKQVLPKQEQILQEGDILRFASEEYEYLIIRG